MAGMTKERIVVVEDGADILRDAVARETLGWDACALASCDRQAVPGRFVCSKHLIEEGRTDPWGVAIMLAQAADRSE